MGCGGRGAGEQPLERTKTGGAEDACGLLVPLDEALAAGMAGESRDDYPDDEGGRPGPESAMAGSRAMIKAWDTGVCSGAEALFARPQPWPCVVGS